MAALFLVVGERLAHEILITGEVQGQAAEAFLFHVALEHFFLERNVHGHVAVLCGLVAIVEGEQEGIGEKHPVETLGIEIRGKRNAIGEARCDVHLVQNAVPVRGIAGSFGRFLFVDKPFGVFGLEIVVGVGEQRLGGGHEFGIVVAQAKYGAFAGRRGHRVHVGIVGEGGVRMVVVDRDAGDLLAQACVDSLDVAAGKRFGLGPGGRSSTECREENRNDTDHLVHGHLSKLSLRIPTAAYRETAARQCIATLAMRSKASSSRFRALTSEKRR